MSFWKFGSFTQQSAIDTLLNAASGPPTPGSGSFLDPSNMSAGSHGSNSDHVPILTLEQLLEEDDLLQECKNGHNKLVDFLGRPRIVHRVLDYVDGSAFEADDEIPSTPSEHENRQRKRLKYPHVCSEIILCNVPSVMQELFKDLDVYIKPFWATVLDRFETHDDPHHLAGTTNTVQLGYWIKVNSFLLAERPFEMIAYFKSNPKLVSRLIQHIPSSTAISDLVFRFLQTEESGMGRGMIEYICTHPDLRLVSRLIDYLSPEYPAETHNHVAEFVKAIINFCSTANSNAATAEFSQPSSNSGQGAQTAWGQAKGNGHQEDEKPSHWVDSRLLRELASEDSVARLLGYMFDVLPVVDSQKAQTEVKIKETNADSLPKKEDPITPTTSTFKDFVSTPAGSAEASLATSVASLPANQSHLTPAQPSLLRLPTVPLSPFFKSNPTADSVTSSLTNSLAILIDLIRKNNSDFSEQQILHYLRKRIPPDPDPSDGKEGKSTAERIQEHLDDGPTVVHLGPLLRLVSERLGDFQTLLKNPRSDTTPLHMTQGTVIPLALERFRICEFYAELLHCSNMALLNRKHNEGPQYDANGHLSPSEKAIDVLEAAISNPPPASDDLSSPTVDPGSAQTSTYNSPQVFSDESFQLPAGMEDISLESPAQSPAQPKNATFSRTDESGKDQSIDQSPRASISAGKSKSQAEAITAGQLLKTRILEHKVTSVLIDLFFEYPWNNFLHNVIYDLLQQTFNGRMDNTLCRQLCLHVFTEDNLTSRILQGQAENDKAAQSSKGVRMGYMGHMSLIAEEIVKVFNHYPEEIFRLVKDTMDTEAWDSYVTDILRITRQNDNALLGGGVSAHANDTISSSSGMSDDDDEFPMSNRSSRIMSLNANEGSEQEAKAASLVGNPEPNGTSSNKTNDQFARYLIQQISSDLPDKFTASSDEEEDEWHSGFDPKDSDFGLWESDRKTAPLNSSAEGDFADFEASSSDKKGFDDSVGSTKQNLTPADWNSDFKTNYDSTANTPVSEGEGDPFASAEDDEDDDFGDFAEAPEGQISLPSFEDNFDFNASASGFPSFEDAGSSVFDSGAASAAASGFGKLADVVDPAKEVDRDDGLVEVENKEEPGSKLVVPRDEAEVARKTSL